MYAPTTRDIVWKKILSCPRKKSSPHKITTIPGIRKKILAMLGSFKASLIE